MNLVDCDDISSNIQDSVANAASKAIADGATSSNDLALRNQQKSLVPTTRGKPQLRRAPTGT